MIVALAIFSVVALVALGALVRIISANQKAQAIQTAVTNLNFALESMSREIRMGVNYHCDSSTGTYDGSNLTFQACAPNAAATGVSVIAFTSTRRDTANNCNLATVYRMGTIGTGIHLQKAEQMVCSISVGNNDFVDILSPNVTLTDYHFSVSADSYPLVFLEFIGYAGDKEKNRTYFDVQTAVSERLQK